MHRIGFRRVLPIVFTLIHIVLVWFAQTGQPHASPRLDGDPRYRPVMYQEDVSVPVEFLEPPPLKPVEKCALILELPAMYLAVLMGAVLLPRNEIAWVYLSIPLVPLVWYAVGRWLDGVLGYIVRLRLPEILRKLLLVAALVVLPISVAGLTPLYHHRTADTYWEFAGMALWSGLCVAIPLSCSVRSTND